MNHQWTVICDGKPAYVLAVDRDAAIERAIKKLYGRRCFFREDSGLEGWGQVFKALAGGGATSRTYRIQITAERGWYKQSA